MKKIIQLVAMAVLGLSVSSCELSEIDNYDSPNATLSGGIYDKETNELVQQDIIRGMQIEYIEHGFSNPQTQYIVVKNDGSYRNNLMFANTYSIRPVRGNFVPIESQEVQVKGDTEVDFKVQPYIRIRNSSIKQEGNKIVGTFQIQQTVTNPVKRIGLFAHSELNVGEPLNLVSSQLDINAQTNESQIYRLEIDLDTNSARLGKGKSFFFRIGALIDASEAKFNYAPALRLVIQ